MTFLASIAALFLCGLVFVLFLSWLSGKHKKEKRAGIGSRLGRLRRNTIFTLLAAVSIVFVCVLAACAIEGGYDERRIAALLLAPFSIYGLYAALVKAFIYFCTSFSVRYGWRRMYARDSIYFEQTVDFPGHRSDAILRYDVLAGVYCLMNPTDDEAAKAMPVFESFKEANGYLKERPENERRSFWRPS